MLKYVLFIFLLFSVPALAQDRVSKFDENNDQKVDFNELNTSCEVSVNLFNRADKNKDGKLSNIEMRAAKAYLFNDCKIEKHA